MKCLSPYISDDRDLLTGLQKVFPCGKCYSCVMRVISGWHFRLETELLYSNIAKFVTLTYDTDFVPIDAKSGKLCLCASDLQAFFKRLRSKVMRHHSELGPMRLRYYAVGEYGGRNERPHYHAIVFDASPELIYDAWKTGFKVQVFKENRKGEYVGRYKKIPPVSIGNIKCDPVTSASIGYVVGYTRKSFFREWNDDRPPPFANMSKYLGVNYLSPEVLSWHKADLNERCYIPLDGKKRVAMPRYFKDMLYNENEREILSNANRFKAIEWQKGRDEWWLENYGDRAASVKLDYEKQLFIKLQNKKEKRKL